MQVAYSSLCTDTEEDVEHDWVWNMCYVCNLYYDVCILDKGAKYYTVQSMFTLKGNDPSGSWFDYDISR